MMRLLSVLFISLFLQSFPAHANNDRDNPKQVHAPWGYPKDADAKDDYIIERK